MTCIIGYLNTALRVIKAFSPFGTVMNTFDEQRSSPPPPPPFLRSRAQNLKIHRNRMHFS